MKKLIVILLCVFLLIIDNTLLPFFAVKGFYPSSLLIFILFYSINNEHIDAIAVAVFAGLLQDMSFCQVIGINPLVNIYICLIAVEIGKNIFKEKRLIPVFSLFILSVAKGFIVFAFLYLVGLKTDYHAAIYNSIYTMILAVFLYKPIYRLLQKPFMKKQWKF